jgi:hypothetical protein
MLDSKGFEINKKDLVSVGKGALLVGVSAILTYVGQNLAHIDLGAGSALIVPVVSMLLDSAIKWIKDNTK